MAILTILHTNDIHGRLDQMPRLATLIARERSLARDEGRHVLLLDAGDSSERSIWESSITKGRANFIMLEAMGYDASTVGNGETFQWGLGALAKLVESVHFPVLAANLFAMDSDQPPVPGLKSHAIFEIEKLKIAVLGITVDDNSAYKRFGYRCEYAAPVLRDLIPRLRAEGAQAIILLSHLGFGFDTDEEYEARIAKDPTRANNLYDRQIAKAVPGIDVIVGGHSHTLLNEMRCVGDTVIVQAGDYGKFLGRLDLEIDSDRVKAIHYQVIPCDENVPPDPTLSGMLDLVRFEAGALLKAKLGDAADDLDGDVDLKPDHESAMTDMMADAFREMCHADLGIFLSGFVARGLARGAITRGKLMDAIPGSAHVTAGRVTGAQILGMLDKALARDQVMTPANILRGRALGLPAVSSNVLLTYNMDAPQGKRVVELLIDGQPIDPQRSYRLATTYWTLNDSGDPDSYIFLQEGQTVEMIRIEQVLWEIMEDWIKAKSPLVLPTMGRVKEVISYQ
ncbi:MAG: bifunctional UDP-sugar hydrolase/5'-nucleotidase [Chloroflexota bacterium]